MAKDDKTRAHFVESVVKFLDHHKFDGLDMDWEYPSNRGGDTNVDKPDFIKLLHELRDAFEPHGYLLTAAVSAGKGTIDTAYDIKQMNEYLDYYCVMGYDYHGGSWEDIIGHNAPLYARPDDVGLNLIFNVNYSINYWLSLGADKTKMVLGMPVYGRTYELLRPDLVRFNDTAKGPGPKGPMSGEEGFYGYNDVITVI